MEADWIQLGSDLSYNTNGFARDIRFGSSVSMDSTGTIVAVAAHGEYITHGIVRVYSFNGSNFIQSRPDILGNTKERFGGSVKLSSDGSILAAIGSSVKVYYWNNSAWERKGLDIEGSDKSSSLSLSSDGSILAIGKRNAVKVFVWNGSIWSQRGVDIFITLLYNTSVVLSSNGSILAVGDYQVVRVFVWNGSIWSQRGVDINGNAINDEFGINSSIALSSDGSILAVGASRDDGINGNTTDIGSVKVFSWNGNNWSQLGQTLYGEYATDAFGSSVALSSDGSILAVGAPGNNEASGNDNGQIRVYKYEVTTWNQLGSDIDGEVFDDSIKTIGFLGANKALALSSDGTVVAGGAWYHNYRMGKATVYKYVVPSLKKNNKKAKVSTLLSRL